MDENPLFATDEGDFDDPIITAPAVTSETPPNQPQMEKPAAHETVLPPTPPTQLRENQKTGENTEETILDPRMQIVQRLLSSSPPGQIHSVLSDIEKVIPGQTITEDMKQIMFRSYNLQSFRLVQAANQKMILHEAGEIDERHYLDPATNAVIQVDHINAKMVGDPQPSAGDSALESTRAALQEALGKYLSTHYSGPSVDCAAGCFLAPAQKGSPGLVVALKAERLNLRNLWTGSWQAEYFLPLADSPASVPGNSVLTGTIKIRGHYFDEGNVQLQTKKEIAPTQINYSDIPSLVASVLEAIKSAEQSLQQGLETMYANMSDETLKSMRRILPRTRSKMEWNIYQLRMIQTLKK